MPAAGRAIAGRPVRPRRRYRRRGGRALVVLAFLIALAGLVAVRGVPAARERFDAWTQGPARAEFERRAAELDRRLQELLAGESGRYGIYVLDLRSGAEYGRDADAVFPAASTAKLYTLLYYEEAVARGAVDPDARITYRERDREGGSGIIRYQAVGSTYPLRTLAEYAIVHSDNVGHNMMVRYLGQAQIIPYLKGLGLAHLPADGATSTTPRDLGRALRHLWRLERGGHPGARELLGWMQATRIAPRIARSVPQGVPVASKSGDAENVVNDAALILHPKRPYALVILSDGVPNGLAEKVVDAISAAVYRAVTGEGGP